MAISSLAKTNTSTRAPVRFARKTDTTRHKRTTLQVLTLPNSGCFAILRQPLCQTVDVLFCFSWRGEGFYLA